MSEHKILGNWTRDRPSMAEVNRRFEAKVAEMERRSWRTG